MLGTLGKHGGLPLQYSHAPMSSKPTTIAQPLLDWYATHQRDLPWRNHPHPYAIWVSEIMLQQTRVETVIPYFHRWMEKFPTIEALAQADLQEVLATWEGLGYYSRARNLHAAAQKVVQEYGGKLPADAKQLQKLPGIGQYTAAAIASMGFGRDEVAIDGNLRRVLARVFNIDQPIGNPQSDRQFWERANEHLVSGKAAAYNQAWMDLGATICTPQNPRCLICPLREVCQAYALGLQEQRPVKPPKSKKPHYTMVAAAISYQNTVLIRQRQKQGLLGGLWEFPNFTTEQPKKAAEFLPQQLQTHFNCQVQVQNAIAVLQHAYTHFRVTLHVYRCHWIDGKLSSQGNSSPRWVSLQQLPDYPMGKLDRQIAQRLLDSQNNNASIKEGKCGQN